MKILLQGLNSDIITIHFNFVLEVVLFLVMQQARGSWGGDNGQGENWREIHQKFWKNRQGCCFSFFQIKLVFCLKLVLEIVPLGCSVSVQLGKFTGSEK